MLFWIAGSAALIYTVCQLSSVAKYYIKYIGYLLYCILLTTLCGLFCLFRPGSSKNVVIAQTIARWIQFEWLFGIDIQIENWDNLLKAKKPFVVVSNHQTALDALILLKASPNGTAPLAKKMLLYVPIFGPVCWLCGTIFINRKKGKTAIQVMKKVGEEMTEKMTSVWIFPEGTRSQEDEIKPFKKGAFHLAVQAKVPIVPVLMCNYRNVIDREERLFEGGVIRVKCQEPIETTNMGIEDVGELCEKVHTILQERFDEDMRENKGLYKTLAPIKKIS